MKYLISQNRSNVESAEIQITNNMGLCDNCNNRVTRRWSEVVEIKDEFTVDGKVAAAHPIAILDPSKIGWFAIPKPDDRFMTGIVLQEVIA